MAVIVAHVGQNASEKANGALLSATINHTTRNKRAIMGGIVTRDGRDDYG